MILLCIGRETVIVWTLMLTGAGEQTVRASGAVEKWQFRASQRGESACFCRGHLNSI